MRIITGKLKGRRLKVPQDSGIRPTSDRAKEGLFSVIDARKHLTGTRVLDLFAGTGNLGFEAISRGAVSALFVDSNPLSEKNIRATAAQFGVANQVSVITAPVDAFLGKKPPSTFDIVFADPPYDYPGIPEMPETILNNGWLEPDGWFILEHDVRHLFHEHPNCVFTKPYGRTIVSIFLQENKGEDDQ